MKQYLITEQQLIDINEAFYDADQLINSYAPAHEDDAWGDTFVQVTDLISSIFKTTN